MRGSILLLGVLAACAAGCATSGATGGAGQSASDGKVFEARLGSALVRIPLPAGWQVATWEPSHLILARRQSGGVTLNPTMEILVEPGPPPYDCTTLTARQARRVLGHLGGEVVVPNEWAPAEKTDRGLAGTGSLSVGGRYHELRWRYYDGELESQHLVLASLCAPRGELACDAEFDQMLQALKTGAGR